MCVCAEGTRPLLGSQGEHRGVGLWGGSPSPPPDSSFSAQTGKGEQPAATSSQRSCFSHSPRLRPKLLGHFRAGRLRAVKGVDLTPGGFHSLSGTDLGGASVFGRDLDPPPPSPGPFKQSPRETP